MTDTALATTTSSEVQQPTTRSPTEVGEKPARKPRELRVTGRVRIAIDAMVMDGLNRKKAAQLADLTDHSLYVAFTRPHVKAYYNTRLEVLRTSARARNFHRLEEIRDQKRNAMASVNAIKELERSPDELGAGGSSQRSPGLVIVIQTNGSPMGHMPTIEAKTLIDKGDVRNDE